MSKIIITEKQLENMVRHIKENHDDGSYMAKQQLFTIATLAYKMWEMMEEGDELEDWMAYHASMTNAADAIRHALRERVS